MPEALAQHPAEILANPHPGLLDHIDDPDVSLVEILSEAGLEGLSPEERLTLIEQASVEDYMIAVDAIHRKVAPDYSHEPDPEPVKFIDPKTGKMNNYAARPEERAGAMEHALGAAKQVIRKYREEGGSVEDALARCGNLAAFGVVLAHTYEDGNGRTGRTLGELIHNGLDRSNAESLVDLETLSTNRPESGFRVNSYVPTGEWGGGRANADPMAFLDAVAALDTPLDGTSYASAAYGAFRTPRI